MGKSYEELITIPEDTQEIITKLNAYLRQEKRYTNISKTEMNGGTVVMFQAVTIGNFKSVGENIQIQCIAISEGTQVQIQSECKQRTQVIDWGVNKDNVNKLKFFLRSGMYVVFPEEEKNASSTTKTSKSQKEKPVISPVSCIYCGGHEDLEKETYGNLWLYNDRLEFGVIRKKFAINIDDITDNRICTYQQALQRLTLTRIALFGIFATAMPKKELYQQSYLEITCKERGVESCIIFRPEKNSKIALNNLIKVNSELIKLRKNRYQK